MSSWLCFAVRVTSSSSSRSLSYSPTTRTLFPATRNRYSQNDSFSFFEW